MCSLKFTLDVVCPHLLQSFMRAVQHCLVVTLQKYFVYYKTVLAFHQHD